MALAISLIMHAGIGMLAVRGFCQPATHAPTTVSTPIEWLTSDVEVATSTDDTRSTPSTATAPLVIPRSIAPTPTAHHAAAATATKPAALGPPSTVAEPVPASDASRATDFVAPRFMITVAKTVGVVGNVSDGALPDAQSPSALSARATSSAIPAASVDVPAKLRVGNLPTYTAAAIAAGIEANVPLEIVVSESGIVTSARALEHIGYGLDESARRSVLGYRFAPAMRNNRAVAVRMRWLMRFQLR